MYSLDVNFLRDRAPSSNPTTKKKRAPMAIGDLTPLYIGGGIAVFSLVLVATGWFILQGQNSKLAGEITGLDQENQRLESQIGSIKKIRQEISQVKSETQALVTVFDQIRPWSAMLEDVKERIPTTTQLETIKQIAAPIPGASSSTANSASPVSSGAIEVGGVARSFNDVNDFLLTLQQSRFFKSTETRINTADLVDATLPPGSVLPPGAKPPKVVKYTIQSSMSDVRASELMRELEQKGTVGLVARIRSLQQTGALQK